MYFFKKPIVITLIILLILVFIIVAVIVLSGEEELYDYITVGRGDVVQEVSVTGRIKAAEEVDLAFGTTGRVARIYVGVGDKVWAEQVLAELKRDDLLAQLAEAEANLEAEQAKLNELRRGTRTEEIKVQEARVANAKQDLVDKLQDSYTKSDDAVRNKIDQMISNPRSNNPQINITVSNTQLKSDIESQRIVAEPLLISWKTSLDGISVLVDLDSYTAVAKNNLNSVKSLLDKVALAVNDVTSSASISQTLLDSYKSDISTARTNVNTAIGNLSTAESALIIEEQKLLLNKAGTTAEQIAAQEAKVSQAEAKMQTAQTQVNDTVLRSPISGIITVQDTKVGSYVSANTVLISVISDSKLEIEADVVEADLANLEVGDSGIFTLDAYGEDIIFSAHVSQINPAGTLIEGVATYRTKLQLDAKDGRIKPGMTANLDILTAKRENVISIPQRAVIFKGGSKYVRVLRGKEIEEREVKLGLSGSLGNVEILEGLEEGEKLILSIR